MERRIAAILAADMVGFSRLIEINEEETLGRQKRHRLELFEPELEKYNGKIVKHTGDGFIAEFNSVVEAVQFAVVVQNEISVREETQPSDRRICYRLAINLGDVVVDDGDVFGDGVNIAARLEAFADPGGVVVSGTAHDLLKNQIDVAYRLIGEKKLKNISAPVRVYSVERGVTGKILPTTQNANSTKLKWVVSIGFAALVAVGIWLVSPFVGNFKEQFSSSGDLLLSAQNKLEKLDYHVGKKHLKYGAKLRNAVSEFQKTRGLPITGAVTEETAQALGIDYVVDKEAADLVSSNVGIARFLDPEALSAIEKDERLLRAASALEKYEMEFGFFNGHLYLAALTQKTLSWEQTQEIANSFGGYMVVISSREENEFVYSLVERDDRFWAMDDIGYSWIGPALGFRQLADSNEPSGGWVWANGEEVSYTNWLAGQPNDWGGTEYYAAFMDFASPNERGNPPRRSRYWGDVLVPQAGVVIEIE